MVYVVAAMAIIDTKLVPVLIEKLQTELDEIKVICLLHCLYFCSAYGYYLQ